MANKIYIDGTIAYRQDTLENWQTKNPVLEAGEPAIVSDAADGNWLKIGDGQTPWNDLPYKKFTDAGNTVKADQSYNPKSENAQSGTAVAEAIQGNKIYARNTFANALKGTKSGSVISVNDVSVVEHNLGVRVGSKNLLSITPTRKLKTDFANCFYLPKGTYTVSMIFTNATSWRFTITLYDLNGTLITDTTINTTHLKGINSVLNYSSGHGGIYQNTDNITSNYLIFETDNDYYIGINFYFGDTTADTTVTNPQIELGTTATEYTPYVNVSTVNVSRYGKNLIKYPYNITNQTTKNGITFTDNGDGTVTLNGTATEIAYFEIVKPYTYLTKSNYFLSGCADSGDYGNYAIQIDCNGTAFYDFGNGVAIPKTADVSKCRFFIQVKSGVTVNNITFKPQLEIGTTATEYEPYKEPQTATANVDGTVDNITSLYPNTTLLTDTEGVIIDCEYNRDINKAFAALEAAIATNNS